MTSIHSSAIFPSLSILILITSVPLSLPLLNSCLGVLPEIPDALELRSCLVTSLSSKGTKVSAPEIKPRKFQEGKKLHIGLFSFFLFTSNSAINVLVHK